MMRFTTLYTFPPLYTQNPAASIAFLFSLVIAWQMVFEKTFQAVGRMTTTMICMMVGFVVNIVLDPVMIFGLCGSACMPWESRED